MMKTAQDVINEVHLEIVRRMAISAYHASTSKKAKNRILFNIEWRVLREFADYLDQLKVES